MPGTPRKTWGYCPVRWLNRHAIVELPEHIDLSNVGEIREQLLSIVNREVLVLVVDMSAAVSCDHAGSDALARVYQRALASGTELRLVVASEFVRRVLSINGVDRLISLYPTVETALAATVPSESAWAVLAGEAADVGWRALLLGVTSRFNVGRGRRSLAMAVIPRKPEPACPSRSPRSSGRPSTSWTT